MRNRESGLINYEQKGILADLLRSPLPHCNRTWGPEYLFFSAQPLSEKLMECIAQIKIIQWRAEKAQQETATFFVTGNRSRENPAM
jgi:hypothetical protein